MRIAILAVLILLAGCVEATSPVNTTRGKNLHTVLPRPHRPWDRAGATRAGSRDAAAGTAAPDAALDTLRSPIDR